MDQGHEIELRAAAPGGAADPRARYGHERFAALFAAHRSPIYNLAYRLLSDREDAADAAQDVFFKAYRHLEQQGRPRNERAWLYAVTVNTCRDHLRARYRRGPQATVDLDEGPTRDEFELTEMSRAVRETLSRLSDRHREVLVLKDLHGLRLAEIATAMGTSAGAAQVLLFRARRAFRSTFVTLTAAGSAVGGCAEARRAARELVGREISDSQRRRLEEHVRTCPDCSCDLPIPAARTGLAIFLPQVLVPEALEGIGLTAGQGGLAASAAAASAASTGSWGSGGILASLFSGGSVKVATVAATAVVVVGGAGLGGHKAVSSHTRATVGPVARTSLVDPSVAFPTATADLRGRGPATRSADSPAVDVREQAREGDGEGAADAAEDAADRAVDDAEDAADARIDAAEDAADTAEDAAGDAADAAEDAADATADAAEEQAETGTVIPADDL